MATNTPTSMSRPTPKLPTPWEQAFGFPLFNRLSHELDEMLSRTGFGRPMFDESGHTWMPPVEMTAKDGRLLVKVDVPGMKKEDLTLEVTDGQLVLRGERKQEKEEKKDGFFRTERTYGSFTRTVALPEGARVDTVTASLHDGVLEIAMPMEPVEEKTRTIAIGDPVPAQATKAE